MARQKPEKPLVKQAAEFVIFHLADKTAFHPFTGTDYDAWHAFIPTVRLWGRMRDDATVVALKNIVGCAQRNTDVLAVFKKAIPCLLDWSDEVKLWPRICPRQHMGDTRFEMPCADGERICHHDNSKPYRHEPGHLECKDCGTIWIPRSVITRAQ